MSLKYSNTTADRLDWADMLNLTRKLIQDGNYKIALFITLGSFWGLRVYDMKQLTWLLILDKDEIIITEHKTEKKRTIPISPQLKKFITDCYNHINPVCLNSPVFLSQKKTVYSTQQLNRILKQIKTKYRVNVKNFSCHSLRKTFGRQVYNQNPENAERALVMLMDMFNHSSLAITRRYIGLRQEEVAQTYESLSF
ncbi:tyrosine-type recombinase/integrase [Butyricimonas synergistica]|uniref:tyrosine-type recombinase/integrase n=1 Tax=Butyricimonas synergistica TaxID=544644 RepID=UPI00035F87C6|nr:tyrosine-type recombinase/integrase [Butyricimonas synergistica]